MHPKKLFIRRRVPNLSKLTTVTRGQVFDQFMAYYVNHDSGTRIFSFGKTCSIDGANRKQRREIETFFLVDDDTFALMERGQNPATVWQVVNISIRADRHPLAWEQVIAVHHLVDETEDPVFWSCPKLVASGPVGSGMVIDLVFPGEGGARDWRFAQHELMQRAVAA